jgi:DNA-directed RNA polymerase subunit K/omega
MVKKSLKKIASKKISRVEVDNDDKSSVETDIDEPAQLDQPELPEQINQPELPEQLEQPETLEENMDEVDDEDKLDETNIEVENEDKEEEVEAEVEQIEEIKNDDGDDNCMYRFTKKANVINEDDDEEYDEEEYFEEEQIVSNEKYVSEENRITKPILTKYERVRILGERARQLSLGAKPMIHGVAHLDPKEVAKMELKQGVMPLIIERQLSSGQCERWKVRELKIVN